MNRRIARVTTLAAAAAVIAFALSPAPALADRGATHTVFSALTAAALVGLGALPLTGAGTRTTRARVLTVAISALALALGAYVAGGIAQRRCTTTYDGSARVIGTELTATGTTYLRENPDLSSADLLFDAAGAVDRVWTPASIARCGIVVGATHVLWVPFVVLALLGFWEGASVQAVEVPVRRPDPRASATQSSTPRSATARYDAFLSYRHGGTDADVARQVLDALEARGYRLAIDERDFPANESFLLEMERCIRESRFTIAIVSSRYLESDNCQEEAIICKVLDMGERKRRLIPVTIEAVSMPTWLYGIVGVDFTKANPLVDPFEKLVATLGPPARG